MTEFMIAETVADAEGISEQVMVLPDQVWTRKTDGKTKGHAFRWAQVTPAKPLDEQLPLGKTLAAVGKAKFTNNDRDLASIGRVSQIATKALREMKVVSREAITLDLLESLHMDTPRTVVTVEDLVVLKEIVAEPLVPETIIEITGLGAGVIPKREVYEKFVSQKVHGVDLLDMMDDGLKHGEGIRLEGPTGCGKTMAVKAYCAREQIPLYTVNFSADAVPATMFGSLQDLGTWQNGVVTQAILSSQVRPTALLLDELTLATQRALGPMFPLLNADERFITLLEYDGRVVEAGRYEDGGGLLIVATMNNNYAGNMELNEAIRRRFTHVAHMTYNKAVESKLVSSKTLLKLAYEIRGTGKNKVYRTDVGTDWLIAFEELVARRGLDYAIGNFIDHFHEDEVAALKVVMDSHRANLRADFSLSDDTKDLFAELDVLDVS